MPNRVKYIKVLFDDNGFIVREYKSVHFEGEGAPRDVDLEPTERQAICGAAQEAGLAALSEMASELRRADARALSEQSRAELAEAKVAHLQADVARLEASLNHASDLLEDRVNENRELRITVASLAAKVAIAAPEVEHDPV